MRRIVLSLTAAALLLPSAVSARQSDEQITNRDPDAMDVAKTPVTDLNIVKDEIPAVLIAAQDKPYDQVGLKRCSHIASAIEELDILLGPDIDLPQEERDRLSAGRVAKWVVGSFIPFRGLIREVSGANSQERKVRAAIQAGLARRGFLKGVGAAKGCDYPARPAPASLIAARQAEIDAEKNKKEDKDGKDEADVAEAAPAKKGKVAFRSEPVVQKIP